MTRAPDDALLALLEEERAALLSGNLSALEDWVDRKMQLARAIAERADRIPRSRMAGLAAAAERNAALCEAARRGLRDAIDRISERAGVANHLETYGSDGQRHRHAGAPRHLEKRS